MSAASYILGTYVHTLQVQDHAIHDYMRVVLSMLDQQPHSRNDKLVKQQTAN